MATSGLDEGDGGSCVREKEEEMLNEATDVDGFTCGDTAHKMEEKLNDTSGTGESFLAGTRKVDEDACESHAESEKRGKLSKAERKQLRYLSRCEKKKARRHEVKLQRRKRAAEAMQAAAASGEAVVPVRVQRAETEARLAAAMEPTSGALQLVVDCSMQALMSRKEIRKLAQQFLRLYGANRRSPDPAHIWLTSLEAGSDLEAALRHACDGFDSYKLTRTAAPYHQQFPVSSLVVLTPDAGTELEVLDKASVYVLGGLVDEHPQHGTTLSRASSQGLRTARLPLARYCQLRDKRSALLPINLVGAMLVDVSAGAGWEAAIRTSVPKRFILPDDPS